VGHVDLNASRGWSGRSVLVTGAAGLLGGWVCRQLHRSGARVVGLDNNWEHGVLLGGDDSIEKVHDDVRDSAHVEQALRAHAVDTVIHLAAQAYVGPANERPVETFEHNVLGTWSVLDACRRFPQVVSVVVASSDKAYGDHGGRPYEETMPLLARHPYDASKACADMVAQTYAQSFGMPVAITRCANMYGGGDTEWSRIVPGTIRSVLRGERPVVRSDGTFVRSYLYVEDAAAAVIALADQLERRADLAGEAFNFAADTELSVLDLVARIMDLAGCALEPDVRNEAVNEIREQRVLATKARDVLGWTPRHGLAEGLTLAIDWYRAHLGAGG
jgi:CDP-glucose 4,6-dehydratase